MRRYVSITLYFDNEEAAEEGAYLTAEDYRCRGEALNQEAAYWLGYQGWRIEESDTLD